MTDLGLIIGSTVTLTGLIGGVIWRVRKGLRSEKTCDTIMEAFQKGIDNRFDDSKENVNQKFQAIDINIRRLYDKQDELLKEMFIITGYLKKNGGI